MHISLSTNGMMQRWGNDVNAKHECDTCCVYRHYGFFGIRYLIEPSMPTLVLRLTLRLKLQRRHYTRTPTLDVICALNSHISDEFVPHCQDGFIWRSIASHSQCLRFISTSDVASHILTPMTHTSSSTDESMNL